MDPREKGRAPFLGTNEKLEDWKEYWIESNQLDQPGYSISEI